MRRSLYLAVGVFTAFVLVFMPSTAQAASVPKITTMGGPINVLPSAVKAATGAGAGLSQADMMAVTMYRASKSPEFWALYSKAQQTATSTGKALVLSPEVAAEAKTIYPAASKVAPFVKGAGAVGAVVTAYQMSSTLTNGAADLLGFDATGTVCSGVGQDLWGKVVATAAGANCAGFYDMAKEFVANADAAGGYGLGVTCDGSGVCITGIKGVKGGSRVGSIYPVVIVMTGTGSADFGGNIFFTSKGWPDTLGVPIDRCWGNYLSTGICNSSEWIGTQQGPSTGGFYDDASAKAEAATVQIRGVKPYGQPETPANPSTADPKRTLKCVVAGSDGNTYVGVSDEFLESGGVLPKVTCKDLPEGVTSDGMKIIETGGDNGEQTIWEAQTDDAVKNALATTGCGTSTATQCPLVLYKDGESCFDGADCQGWYKDPDKSKYRCEYGGKTVALTECTTYAPRWEPDQIRKGDTLGDPDTGKPLTNPKPQLDPNSDVGTGSAGATSPDSGEPCWSTSWGVFNPLTWVYRPIQCAVQWALIPRASEVTRMQTQFKTTYAKTAPAELGKVVGGWDFHPTATGCSGITIPWSKIFGHNAGDWHFLAACDGDPLVPIKNAGNVFLVLVFLAGGGFGAYRIVGSTIKIAKIGSF